MNSSKEVGFGIGLLIMSIPIAVAMANTYLGWVIFTTINIVAGNMIIHGVHRASNYK